MSTIESDPDTVGVAWMYDLARFTRGDDLMILLKQLHAKGVQLTTHRDAVDLNTFDGRVLLRSKQFINALYADVLSDSQRKRVARERAKGAWMGRAPQGMKIEGRGEKRHLVPSSNTYSVNGVTRSYMDTVKEFIALYTSDQDLGTPAISEILNNNGYRILNIHYQPGLVSGEVLGNILDNLDRYRGLVSNDLLDRAIQRRQERSKRAVNGRRHKTALLQKILFCSWCGERFTVGGGQPITTPKGTRTIRSEVYRHSKKPGCTHRHSVVRWHVDNQVLEIVGKFSNLSENDRRTIAEECAIMGLEAVDTKVTIQSQIDKLEDLYLTTDTMKKENYLARRADLCDQLEKSQLATRSRKTVQEYLEFIDSLVTTLKQISFINPISANRIIRDIFNKIILDPDTGKVTNHEVREQFKTWLKENQTSG